MVYTMARYSVLRMLCAVVILLTSAFAHMQMEEPSPLRDPHSNRLEPKDYNILTPLHADGSDFSCKGYQWNTPLTSVATYQAGDTYQMRLKGGATHGGGSCQISLSCNNGIHFKVLKSIEGGCPLQKEYDFTIPDNAQSAQCLLAWTWFNRVGNREMYMNCAVVDIVGAKGSTNRKVISSDATKASGDSAQAALDGLPDLFVANLAGINDCKTKETVDLAFNGQCTGIGRKSAGDSSSSPPGNEGQLNSENNSQEPVSKGENKGSSKSQYNDGQWHAEDSPKPASKDDYELQELAGASPIHEPIKPSSQKSLDGQPQSEVEKALNEYLESIGDGDHSRINSVDEGTLPGSLVETPKKEQPISEERIDQSQLDEGNGETESYGPQEDGNSNSEDNSSYYDGPAGDSRRHRTRQASDDGESISISDSGAKSEPLEAETAFGSDPTLDGTRTLVDEPDSNPAAIPEVSAPTEDPVLDESQELVDPLAFDYTQSESFTTDLPSHSTFGTDLPTETAISDLSPSGFELLQGEELPEPESLVDFEEASQPEELSDEEFPSKLDAVMEDSEINFNRQRKFRPKKHHNNYYRKHHDKHNRKHHGKHHHKHDYDYDEEDSDIPACSGVEPVTRYVKPPPEWYASHTGPPSASSSPDDDIEDSDGCEDPVWNCHGCRSPNRCVRINACTRSCTRMPYTHLAFSTSELISASTPESITSPNPTPAANVPQQVDDDDDDDDASNPSPSTIPPPPAAAAPDANQCSTSPIPYATGDPTNYLPCQPGTFLCKSETQFYTCGQFGGSDWTYGTLRDVAEGMFCQPNLEQGDATLRKRQDLSRNSKYHKDLESKVEPNAVIPNVASLLQQLEDLSAEIVALYDSISQKAEEDELQVEEEPVSEEDYGYLPNLRRAIMNLFRREWDDDESFDKSFEFGDELEGAEFDVGSDNGIEETGDLDGFEEPSSHQLELGNCFKKALIEWAAKDQLLAPKNFAAFSPLQESPDSDDPAGEEVSNDTCAPLIEPVTNESSEIDLDAIYDRWATNLIIRGYLANTAALQRKHKRQDVDVPEFQYSDGSDGGDGIEDDAESLFGNAPDPLYEGLVNPNAEYEADESRPESIPPEQDEQDAESEKDSEMTSNSTHFSSEPTRTGDEGSKDTETDGHAESDEIRMRQNIPKPKPTIEAEGGDGLDDDPVAIFGAEPEDYEKYWPVSEVQGAYLPHASIRSRSVPVWKPAPRPAHPEKPSSKLHGRRQMHIWNLNSFWVPVEDKASDDSDDEGASILFSGLKSADTLYENIQDQSENVVSSDDEHINLIDTDFYPAGLPMETPISGFAIDPIGTAALLYPTAASGAISQATATAAGEVPPYPMTNSSLASSNATTSQGVSEAPTEQLTEDVDDGELVEYWEWYYEEDTAPSIAKPLPEATANVDPEPAASILPYFMGHGPVVPSGVSIDWPAPSSSRDAFVEEMPSIVDTGAKLTPISKRETPGRVNRMQKEAQRQVNNLRQSKRQACPLVPRGYHRADQYVKRSLK